MTTNDDDFAARVALAKSRWRTPLPPWPDDVLVACDERIEADLANAPPMTPERWDRLEAALGVKIILRDSRPAE
jgi:hypothetical protein